MTGLRVLRAVIAEAARAHYVSALSKADAEDRLAARGVMVGREAARLRVDRFGAPFAARIPRDRPGAVDRWRIAEVVLPRNGGSIGLGGPFSLTARPPDCLFRRGGRDGAGAGRGAKIAAAPERDLRAQPAGGVGAGASGS